MSPFRESASAHLVPVPVRSSERGTGGSPTEAQLFESATSKKRKPDEVAGKLRERAVSAARKIAALASQLCLSDVSPHGAEIAKESAQALEGRRRASVRPEELRL